MKHKHEKYIKLMADGVRIECCISDGFIWRLADWDDFNAGYLQFRIAPDQPADEEGWITWHGGETLAISERIDVRFKNWPTQENTTAGQWRWEIRDRETDIVAYRIVKKKVKKWRWMFLPTAERNYASLPQFTPYFATEEEARRWCNAYQRLGPRQDWTEVECDE